MERQYVGIDLLHRRRSVIYRMNAAGEKLECVRIDNDPVRLAAEVTKAGPGAHLVVEATYGWYWAVDLLQEMGVVVHRCRSRGPRTGGGRRLGVEGEEHRTLLRAGSSVVGWADGTAAGLD